MSTDADIVQHVICTQPRRISAVSLAERVSAELGETSGPGQRDSLCGYQIRFDTRQSPCTRLTYCSTGVLLRRLHNDASLGDVACIIVDEVSFSSLLSNCSHNFLFSRLFRSVALCFAMIISFLFLPCKQVC